jgi:hypothetical protein
LDSAGNIDTSFAPGNGFNGEIFSVAVNKSNGKFFVGGDYSNYNGIGA